MGQPLLETADRPFRTAEGTGGTETSNVPRGKERIPEVAASEPGGAQTIAAYEAATAAAMGLYVPTGSIAGDPHREFVCRRTVLEEPIGEGENPVADTHKQVVVEREYCRTRGIRWEAGMTTSQG